jgi:DNA repair exonuclease SbcCD ATPase subunit
MSVIKDHQEFLLKLLTNKDSFIRKKIIDQNLAYLNNRLTYYLDKVGLPHTVVFQNDLSVEITQLGQDLDFDNLSRGERNRLILGLSWAFRDVWESLYQNINLMFIDELIDSGMDAAGVENSLGILKKIGRERNKNIYLISHRDELIGRVNNVLKVIKENGFTSYSTDIEIYE